MASNIFDSLSHTDDTRIQSVTPIITPEKLITLFPLETETANFIQESRKTVSDIIHLNDDRLMVITWPCSIHNVDEALQYAEELWTLKDNFENLVIVMRTYFEKPRTTVGWKWLINDPNLDGTFKVEKGLKMARKLLLDINKMWLPVSMEFLDTISPQDIWDLITWWAIWARTTESQLHRELVSWLSAVVWFKNGTTWDIQIAIDAIKSSLQPHNFMSVTKSWKRALVTTTWNPDNHIILRWWGGETNYEAHSIEDITQRLRASWIETGIIVDLSHANSEKDYKNQPKVSQDVAQQIAAWNKNIVGVMIESNINEWSQKFTAWKDNPANLQPWISITDSCVSIKTTKDMLAELNRAVWERKKRNKNRNRVDQVLETA